MNPHHGLCVAYREAGPFGGDVGAPQLLDTLSGDTVELDSWGSVAFIR